MEIREKKRAAPGRASATGGEARTELGLPRGGREGGRPAVGPIPPPPGLLPLLLPRVYLLPPLLRAPDPPLLGPAPPPHFLKYATCVLAPPTPRYVTVTGAT